MEWTLAGLAFLVFGVGLVILGRYNLATSRGASFGPAMGTSPTPAASSATPDVSPPPSLAPTATPTPTPLAPWDHVTDDRATTIAGTWTVDGPVTAGGQMTERQLQIAPMDGSVTWFTDCGDPLPVP